MTDPVLRIILVPATSQTRTYEVSYKRLRVLSRLWHGSRYGSGVYDRDLGVHGLTCLPHGRARGGGRFNACGARADSGTSSTAQYRRTPVRGHSRSFCPRGFGGALRAVAPASTGSLSRSSGSDEGRDDRPDSWPLVERGFVTQGRFDEDGRVHPGLDIATPTGSYIRAAGGGSSHGG